MNIFNDIGLYVIITLLALVGVVLLIMLLTYLRNPIPAKMGLRNIPRRPTQSALIVLGLTLSTVIIVSALATGDTLTYSIERQVIDAYGEADEVLAPPILGTLAQLGIDPTSGPIDDGETNPLEADLLAGGLNSVLALLQDGLPGISEERYAELRDAALDEPLIDGTAPSILFPIIVRDRTSGQSEPYGFLFAVDEEYVQNFGLVDTEGNPVAPEDLAPGVGNVFELASDLTGGAAQLTRDAAGQLGLSNVELTDVALVATTVGALIADVAEDGTLDSVDLEALGNAEFNAENVDLEALQASLEAGEFDLPTIIEQLGIGFVEPSAVSESAVSEPAISETVALTETAALTDAASLTDVVESAAAEMLADEEAVADDEITLTAETTETGAVAGGEITGTEGVTEGEIAAVGDISATEVSTDGAVAAGNEITETETPTDSAIAASDEITPANPLVNTLDNIDINELTSNLLDNINLNTLGEDIDASLAQAGLQLRQGEVYLSRLGAERLGAQPGDILDVYIGPIPIPYRVVDIVDGAGPAASLAPVVVMNMDEAQRLLFMEGRVNAVLVSNEGTGTESMALTPQVTERLHRLVTDEEAVAEVLSVLREPDVRREFNQFVDEVNTDNPFAEGGEVPEFLSQIADDLFNVRSFGVSLQQLQAALDEPGVPDAAVDALADRAVQFSLIGVASELPTEQARVLNSAISQVYELEPLDFLSKQTIFTAAELGGTAFSSVFSLFAFFSILAGILLVFMIFVMLAAERRSELGMARAVGMQRRQLVQMFVSEGLIYDLLAGVVGLGLGLLVSWAMIGFVSGLFGDITERFSGQVALTNLFQFRFNVANSSLIIAYCVGVLFTFVIVLFASVQASRVNIIAAVRDLPEESFRQPPLWRMWLRRILGVILLGAGVYVTFFLGDIEVTQTQLGASLILFGAAIVVDAVLRWTNVRASIRSRVTWSVIGIGLLVTWIVPWARILGGEGALFEQNPFAVLAGFALSGPLIILGAILTVMYNADVLLWLVNRIFGGIGALTPVLRTAIAYPLNARFRTGVAMLLFAMIISTVTIMSVVIATTQTVVVPPDERNLGFDIQISRTLLSFFNPLEDLEAAIAQTPDFPGESIGAIGRVGGDFVRATQVVVNGDEQLEELDGPTLFATGINPGFAEQMAQYATLERRATEFESNADVWEALQTRNDVAVVLPDSQAFYLGDGSLFTLEDSEIPLVELTLSPSDFRGFDSNFGDVETEAEASTGEPRTVQIIGVLEDTPPLLDDDGGLILPLSTLEAIRGEPLLEAQQYVAVADGADVREAVSAIESNFAGSGVNATVLAEQFAAGQAITGGILRLFQGFMALGLLVGIAALGVISSRTVVERRQQIGMLRAIGYQPRMVALSFVLEASFIALVGIGVGVLTGVVLGRDIVGTIFTAVTDGSTLPIPWLSIGAIALVAYLFSLLTTILPAVQASRIYPAEALRYD